MRTSYGPHCILLIKTKIGDELNIQVTKRLSSSTSDAIDHKFLDRLIVGSICDYDRSSA